MPVTPAKMDKDALQQWVLRTLGAPFVKVELGQDHLDDAVEEACRWFSAKKGHKGAKVITIEAGVPEFDLPDDCDTVLDVFFTQDRNSLDRLLDPMALVDGIPLNMVGSPPVGGLLSTYVQTSQYLRQARRVLGTEPEWYQNGRKLVFLPNSVSGLARIEYKSSAFTVEQLNERDHDLVKRKTLANAKTVLGRIRSRFDQFPSAQGNVGNDGATLLGEAREEEERLEDEISRSAMPIGFIRG